MITVVGNLKGGSGKSTVTFNLAVWLLEQGQEVVTFDLDPQATLSDVVEVRTEDGHEPSVSVYRMESDPLKVLRHHQGQALVDVGASNMWAMRQAIALADRVVVPVAPSQADVWSTQRFLNIVAEAVSDRKGGQGMPQVVGFINRADTHHAVRETQEAEEALGALPGVELLGRRLSQRTSFRRSFSEGLAVFELEPSGKASAEFEAFAAALYPGLTANHS
ncbi:nucleotide-binding protein [Endothiovibrio diazotrophicus]